LHNIQSHAEATHIWVRLQQVDSQVILEIADNGKGFIVPDNWAEFVSQKHLGMAGMAERANALGGALVVHSAPNQGTQIQVTVVLPHHKCESSLD